MEQEKENPKERPEQSDYLRQIFDDYKARTNFVGFFDLLYKIDRRLEPERYEDGVELP